MRAGRGISHITSNRTLSNLWASHGVLPAPCQRKPYHSVLGSLLTAKRNNFFSDKKLDGLLLPVIHIAVQLVSVHA